MNWVTWAVEAAGEQELHRGEFHCWEIVMLWTDSSIAGMDVQGLFWGNFSFYTSLYTSLFSAISHNIQLNLFCGTDSGVRVKVQADFAFSSRRGRILQRPLWFWGLSPDSCNALRKVTVMTRVPAMSYKETVTKAGIPAMFYRGSVAKAKVPCKD